MNPSVLISFKDIRINEKIREAIETRCHALAEEFPETTRFELILSADGTSHTAHGHVTGRNTEVASHAEAPELGQAADRVLDTLERQLRKVHDKKIFGQRREAQRDREKRRSEG